MASNDRHDPQNYPDMNPEVLSIAAALDRTLQAVVDTYASLGVPLPDRRYWLTGQPAFDCAQMTVALLGTEIGAVGQTADGPTNCSMYFPKTMTIEVSIVRPIDKTAKTPSAASIQKHSTWQTIDSYVLLKALPAIDRDEHGAPGLGVMGQVATPTGEGGFAATVLTVSLGLT